MEFSASVAPRVRAGGTGSRFPIGARVVHLFRESLTARLALPCAAAGLFSSRRSVVPGAPRPSRDVSGERPGLPSGRAPSHPAREERRAPLTNMIPVRCPRGAATHEHCCALFLSR